MRRRTLQFESIFIRILLLRLLLIVLFALLELNVPPNSWLMRLPRNFLRAPSITIIAFVNSTVYTYLKLHSTICSKYLANRKRYKLEKWAVAAKTRGRFLPLFPLDPGTTGVIVLARFQLQFNVVWERVPKLLTSPPSASHQGLYIACYLVTEDWQCNGTLKIIIGDYKKGGLARLRVLYRSTCRSASFRSCLPLIDPSLVNSWLTMPFRSFVFSSWCSGGRTSI